MNATVERCRKKRVTPRATTVQDAMKNNQPPKTTIGAAPIYWIIAVLMAWGGLLAWGAIRGQPSFDWRKPTIIMGAVGIFVLIWLVLLAQRARKDDR